MNRPIIIITNDSDDTRADLARLQAMIEQAEQIKIESEAQVKTNTDQWQRGNDTTVKGRK